MCYIHHPFWLKIIITICTFNIKPKTYLKVKLNKWEILLEVKNWLKIRFLQAQIENMSKAKNHLEKSHLKQLFSGPNVEKH